MQLGASDVWVTPLGVGAWAWGDALYWQYGRGYGESDVHQAFDLTLAAGINFVDTAEVYGFGKSERFIGQFLHHKPDLDVVIATKFMPLPWRVTAGQLVGALRASLKRLGVPRVDLYQIHWHFPPVSVEGWMDALAQAVQLGLTRAVGVSNYNANQTRRAHRELARFGIPLASNQIEYSLLERAPERNGLVETCRELGVALIAYSPLRMGMLTGKYTPSSPPPGARRRRFPQSDLAAVQPLVAALREVGESHGGKTSSQVALNWVMCRGAIPIPGAKNARQAQENAGGLGWRLTDDQVGMLDEISEWVGKKSE